MSTSNENYFGALKILFLTEGWGMLLEDFRENRHILNDVPSVSDEKDLNFRKGQMAVLSYLINLEETIKRAEEEDSDESAQ